MNFQNMSSYYKYVYFANGSAVLINIWRNEPVSNGGHFVFFPNGKDAIDFFNGIKTDTGVKKFIFGYWPNEIHNAFKYHKGYGVEPYKAWWDGKDKSLYTDKTHGCNTNTSSSRMYCTAIIQKTGGKFLMIILLNFRYVIFYLSF